MNNPPAPDKGHSLRQQAEARLQAREDVSPEALGLEETRRLLHELRVHQVELEMQNEELRRAQDELETSRARYVDLYDFAPVGYVTVSEAGLILKANLTAASLLGVTRSALVRLPLTRFILPEDEDIHYLHCQTLFETGAPQVYDLRMPRPGGPPFWARLEAVAAQDGENGPTVCRLTLSDITDRKRAEEERKRGLYLHAIIETTHDGFWALDGEGRLTDVNAAYCRMSGYRRAELLELRAANLDAVDEPAQIATRIKRIIENGSETFETRHRRKDGSVFDVEVSVARFNEEHCQFICFFRDITERKRAEEEREKLAAQLTQAQKMESVGRLAGGVAHDFNNLLTVINGYSDLLLADLREGDPLRANLAEIRKAGERAVGLTRQLLAFSRKQVLEARALDLNRVVEEMRPMLERLVGEAVEVRVALHAESGTVNADPHQLEQVIMNLAVNARDAMPRGGRLLIETSGVERDESYVQLHPEARAGRYVMLAISDSGAGMDEATRQRIFEPFFTTKGVGQGTGLGLSMVQGIVTQSGGYINVYSEPGRGSTFKIYLPALAEAVADAGKPAALLALGGNETVLVVEDQAQVRDYAVAVLKAYGYRVIQAGSAGEALLIYEREPERIDLVLTDVVMPHISGRELAARLEHMRPGIKVLFMSGYTDNVIVHHGLLDEGVHFIQKPFSPTELAGKVRAALGPTARAARVLVVDDEAGVRGYLRAVLEQGAYQVIEAADGKTALRQARGGQVDLVIVDLVMPEQEGTEIIQALRRDMTGVGIIAISGAFAGEFLRTALTLGADAVLHKPVSADLLLARVEQVLQRRRC